MDKDVVIFRRWPAGGVIALFPLLPAGNGYVTSYECIGQHGGADYALVVHHTSRAYLAESDTRVLLNELVAIGYKLRVLQRRPSRRA